MDENPKTTLQLFCERYHVQHTIYKRGPKKGLVNLPITRDKDLFAYFEAERVLRAAGYDRLIDHARYFRAEDGGTVVTFSPYWLLELEDELPEQIGEFTVEVSPYPVYGMMTSTLVMRKSPIHDPEDNQ